MAMSQQLRTVLSSNAVPGPFIDWLQRQGVISVADLVLAARGEMQHVEQELIIGSQIQLSLAMKVANSSSVGSG